MMGGHSKTALLLYHLIAVLPFVIMVASFPNSSSPPPRIDPSRTSSLAGSSSSNINTDDDGDNNTPIQTKENFHRVMQRVGKTALRPGGRQATRTLQDAWCSAAARHGRGQQRTITASDDDDNNENRPQYPWTVLELAAGMGSAGMEWAERAGCHVTVTDIDSSRMAIAQQTAQERGLSRLIETSVQDMFHLDLKTKEETTTNSDAAETTSKRVFDVAMIEAALTHYPRLRKVACLRGLLDYADEVLIHELCFRGEACQAEPVRAAAKRDIGRAIAIGFNPETEDSWKSLVAEAGWKVTHVDTGPMRLLNPAALLEEEGVRGVARIIWNLARHADLRERVLSTRAVLKEHRDDIGFIIMRAVKE